MGILDKIKAEAAKTGGSRGKFFYVKDGEKARIRFLQELDEGLEVPFHDSYAENINVPCQTIFGRECPYCGESALRTRSQYVWSVYNYDAEEVQILMYPINQCSPLGQFVAAHDQYCTITDRDYVVSCTGKRQNKSFSVLPLDKLAFRNAKVKAFSREALLKYIDAAYPANLQNSSTKNKIAEGEEFEVPFEQNKAAGADDVEQAKALYKQCKEKGLHVEPRKSAEYYKKQLEEFEKQADDWDIQFDADNW